MAQNILASDKESKAVFKGMGANECILDLNWRDLGGLACLEPSIKVLRSAADSAGKLSLTSTRRRRCWAVMGLSHHSPHTSGSPARRRCPPYACQWHRCCRASQQAVFAL